MYKVRKSLEHVEDAIDEHLRNPRGWGSQQHDPYTLLKDAAAELRRLRLAFRKLSPAPVGVGESDDQVTTWMSGVGDRPNIPRLVRKGKGDD